MELQFYVYIMASKSWTLYIGMTNDLLRRVTEHKEGRTDGFSKKYWCKKLVYFERTKYVYNAIEREKEIKGWGRAKKVQLIKTINPSWDDLFFHMT